MGKEQQISTWIFIMLGAFRKKYNLTHVDFVAIIKKYEVIRFLSEQYELPHYYDNDYIIDDMLRHIEEQGGNKDELRRTA